MRVGIDIGYGGLGGIEMEREREMKERESVRDL